jgi:hypothetical protein
MEEGEDHMAQDGGNEGVMWLEETSGEGRDYQRLMQRLVQEKRIRW